MSFEQFTKMLPYYRRVMVFDVETTGLIKKNSLEPLPYILQLSFVVYNIRQQRIEKTFNHYIKISPEIIIDPYITKLTGITNNICDEKGIDILDALSVFYNSYMTCDCLVAHNLDFDKEMIQIELQRNANHINDKHFYMNLMFNDKYTKIFNIDTYCTMKTNIDFCSIYFNNSKRKKFPKLVELYQKLFDETPANLHNSIIDVLVCLRCFLKRRFQIDIPAILFDECMGTYALQASQISSS